MFQKIELIPVVELSFATTQSEITPKTNQYRLLELEDNELSTLVSHHLKDTSIEEACSFFGGYALAVNDTILLHPQCCGLLEEIQDWTLLLDEHFEPFYLSECHPAPLFTKSGDEVIITCAEDGSGDFFPPTPLEITVDYEALKQALQTLLSTLEHFSKKLDSLSISKTTSNISDILVWGRM